MYLYYSYVCSEFSSLGPSLSIHSTILNIKKTQLSSPTTLSNYLIKCKFCLFWLTYTILSNIIHIITGKWPNPSLSLLMTSMTGPVLIRCCCSFQPNSFPLCRSRWNGRRRKWQQLPPIQNMLKRLQDLLLSHR